MEAIVLAPHAALEVVEGIVVERGDGLAERVNLLAMLLDNSTSKDTQRTYQASWQAFFGESPRLGPSWARDELSAVLEFCAWPPEEKRREAWDFQARLVKAGKSPATIQNRASAVRSLLKLAHSIGLSSTDGAGLFPKQNVVKYRDTKGIAWDKAKQLTKLPALLHKGNARPVKLRRLRDTAILRLLVENGIRNNSLISCNVEDFSVTELELWIIEKRKGNQKRRLTISAPLAEHIEAYLRYNKHHGDKGGPLFRSLHRGANWNDTRLTRNGLRDIVAGYGEALGLARRLYPHKLRHTAISKLAKETNGDVVAVQEFSGHADFNTLMIYAKQSRDRQGDLTNLLSKLLND
jgi:integrase/recombinase XerC